MKVLLVGGGGREHALAWAIAQSDDCSELYCAPGNAGIEECATCVDIDAEDVVELTNFAISQKIDLVVVGPEAPLVKGLADLLRKENIAVFGPSAKAAMLEGSKGFMKDLCKTYTIPTAAYERFTDVDSAKAYIRDQGAPIVIKDDALAGGKGVIVAMNEDEAMNAVDALMGSAGIVIEEFLDGEELSYFALTDGESVLPLTSAQDHKRAYDGDKGPNTGGMGAYSPAHLITPALEQKILDDIIEPTVRGMKEKGCPFQGVLYAGIMVVNNEPYLIEYNVRFGDPECQPIMMRLQGDLLTILNNCAHNRLADSMKDTEWSSATAMCIVMAAKGYPGSYQKGTEINGLDEANQTENVKIFHAGTTKTNGKLVNFGGRVLGVTARGENVGHAQRLAYEAVDKIDWPDGFCRRDIGWRAVKAEKDKAA